jgi:hypothetical protein
MRPRHFELHFKLQTAAANTFTRVSSFSRLPLPKSCCDRKNLFIFGRSYLMKSEWLFVPSEGTESYFETLRGYLDAHGCPVALYSDKHTVFRHQKA